MLRLAVLAVAVAAASAVSLKTIDKGEKPTGGCSMRERGGMGSGCVNG